MRPIRALVLLAALAVPASSCASFVTNLPTVTHAVDVTVTVLDALEDFATDLFKVKPDADLQAKVQHAIAEARTALDAGRHALDGLDKITKAQFEGAFNDFRVCYQEVVALLAPFGVNASSGTAKARTAPGGHMTVPPANELPLKS